MKEIIIEELYPEFNNLYGDRGNLLYLTRKLADSGYNYQIIKTNLFTKPSFISRKVDMILLASCGEKEQFYELEQLLKYRRELHEYIEDAGVVLATGNAFELFGEMIEEENGNKKEALAYFAYHAKRFTRLRYNDCSCGDFEGLKIVGFKNQLSHSYGELAYPFLKMEKGCGMNLEVKEEGIHYRNLFATYHIGPLLALNPLFCEYLLKLIIPDIKIKELAFEKIAYQKRLQEFI